MQCHECEADAVGQCRICGKGFCGGHGADLCRGCATAIVAVESPRSPMVKQQYLQCVSRPRMPTVYLDDDGPPECYACQAYARYVCEGCHSLYCQEHGSKDRWCVQCARESRKSTLILLLIVGFFAVLAGCLWGFNWLQRP